MVLGKTHLKMTDSIFCKKCGQSKPSNEFYANKKHTCKACVYTPKSTLSINVWLEDSSSPITFIGITSYALEDLFLKIEDSTDITYIKLSKILKFNIKKSNSKEKVERKNIIFKSTPVIL